MMRIPDEGSDYYLHIIELPDGIHAMVIPNDDSTFSMYIDPRRSFEQQLDDWEHEMWHMIRDDFYNDNPIQVIEGIP